MIPESGLSTPILADFADPQLKTVSPGLGKQAKIPPSPKRPQPIGANAPTAAPRKSKLKIQGLSILCSMLEVPLEVKLLAGSKKTQGHQQETKGHQHATKSCSAV